MNADHPRLSGALRDEGQAPGATPRRPYGTADSPGRGSPDFVRCGGLHPGLLSHHPSGMNADHPRLSGALRDEGQAPGATLTPALRDGGLPERGSPDFVRCGGLHPGLLTPSLWDERRSPRLSGALRDEGQAPGATLTPALRDGGLPRTRFPGFRPLRRTSSGALSHHPSGMNADHPRLSGALRDEGQAPGATPRRPYGTADSPERGSRISSAAADFIRGCSHTIPLG